MCRTDAIAIVPVSMALSKPIVNGLPPKSGKVGWEGYIGCRLDGPIQRRAIFELFVSKVVTHQFWLIMRRPLAARPPVATGPTASN